MKKILTGLLASTLLVTPAISFAQTSDIVITQPLPRQVTQNIKSNFVMDPESYMDMIETYMDTYPEHYSSIVDMVQKFRPELTNNVVQLVAKKGLYNPNPTIKISENPTKFGGNNSLGTIAAVGGGIGLIAAFLSGDSSEDTSPPANDPPANDPPANDPPASDFVTEEFQNDYSLGLIGAHNLYANERVSGEGVKVAVVDSGVDMTHPDLIDNIDSENSFSFRSNSSNVQDLDGHGTHVAGIIAGMKNDTGIHGVAYNSEIVAYEYIYNCAPECVSGGLANLMNRLEASNIRIINNSWGAKDSKIDDYSNESEYVAGIGGQPVLEAVQSYLENTDGILVWASGNDSFQEVDVYAGLPVFFPEAQKNWVTVGAVDANKEIAQFSNRCGISAEWCLMAPGVAIESTHSREAINNPSEYMVKNGTSMAAPFVAGSLALALEGNPELTAEETLQIFYDTAEDLGEEGTDDVYGRGMLRLGEALSPQGTMNIQMSKSTFGEQYSANKSGFVASSFLGDSFKSVTENYKISLTDKYRRNFNTNLSNFIRTSSVPSVIQNDIEYRVNSYSPQDKKEKFILNKEGISVSLSDNIYSSNPSAKLNLENDISSTLVSFNSSGDSGTYKKKGFINDKSFGVAHLGMINESDINAQHFLKLNDVFSANAKIVSGDTVFGKESSDTHSGSLGFTLDVSENTNFSINVGNLTENGSVMGSIGFGAFDTSNTKSKTDFLQIGGSIGLTQASDFLFSASLGETSFDNAGLITNGNLKSEAYSIGYKTSNVFSEKDSLVFGFSQPLSVTSGKINMNIPVGRTASVNGLSSYGVTRGDVQMTVGGKQSPQLEIGYNKSVSERGSLSVGTVYSSDVGATSSMNFSLSF